MQCLIKPGKLVIKNEKGEYQPVEDKIADIDIEIEVKECEIAMAKNPDLKKGLRSQINSLQGEKKELTRGAMKLIDLNHKAVELHKRFKIDVKDIMLQHVFIFLLR